MIRAFAARRFFYSRHLACDVPNLDRDVRVHSVFESPNFLSLSLGMRFDPGDVCFPRRMAAHRRGR